MTEAEWDSCQDPQEMLDFLRSTGKASDRKLRLFAVACCRHVWQLLTDPDSRQGVKVAERFADGRATEGELAAVRGSLWDKVNSGLEAAMRTGAGLAAATTTSPVRADIAATVPATLKYSAQVGSDMYWSVWVELRDAEWSRTAGLLGDIFGPLPFRRVAIDALLLKWNDGEIPRLAQAAYDGRSLPEGTLDVGRLAELAKVLDQAGCQDEDVLAHLRQQGMVHVRGCWMLDLLLGKA